MRNHTPGPWIEDAGFIVGTFSDGEAHDICDPRCAPVELSDEMDANARLIVAAPDMLAALRLALESLDAIPVPQEWDTRSVIRAAIAKAEA